jgi:hypothetical protein
MVGVKDMKKLLTIGMAGLIAVGSIAPAHADWHGNRGGGYYPRQQYHHGGGGAWIPGAVLGGLAVLGLGLAFTAPPPPAVIYVPQPQPYYPQGYNPYSGPYAPAPQGYYQYPGY